MSCDGVDHGGRFAGGVEVLGGVTHLLHAGGACRCSLWRAAEATCRVLLHFVSFVSVSWRIRRVVLVLRRTRDAGMSFSLSALPWSRRDLLIQLLDGDFFLAMTCVERRFSGSRSRTICLARIISKISGTIWTIGQPMVEVENVTGRIAAARQRGSCRFPVATSSIHLIMEHAPSRQQDMAEQLPQQGGRTRGRSPRVA